MAGAPRPFADDAPHLDIREPPVRHTWRREATPRWVVTLTSDFRLILTDADRKGASFWAHVYSPQCRMRGLRYGTFALDVAAAEWLREVMEEARGMADRAAGGDD